MRGQIGIETLIIYGISFVIILLLLYVFFNIFKIDIIYKSRMALDSEVMKSGAVPINELIVRESGAYTIVLQNNAKTDIQLSKIIINSQEFTHTNKLAPGESVKITGSDFEIDGSAGDLKKFNVALIYYAITDNQKIIFKTEITTEKYLHAG
jgi:hypothetical protein